MEFTDNQATGIHQMNGILLCMWIISTVAAIIAYYWYESIQKRKENNKDMNIVNMKKYMDSFTLEDGIKIQTEQLKHWEKVLKPDVYTDLKAHCLEKNKTATDGFSVFRGSDMDNYVGNYFNV